MDYLIQNNIVQEWHLSLIIILMIENQREINRLLFLEDRQNFINITNEELDRK